MSDDIRKKLVLLNKLVQRAIHSAQTKRYRYDDMPKGDAKTSEVLVLLNGMLDDANRLNEILDTEFCAVISKEL